MALPSVDRVAALLEDLSPHLDVVRAVATMLATAPVEVRLAIARELGVPEYVDVGRHVEAD